MITINKELKNLQNMRNVYDNKQSTFNEEVEFKHNRIKTLEARNKEFSEKNMLLQQQLDDTLYKANSLTNEYKTVVNDLDSQSKIVTDFQSYKGRMDIDYENLKAELHSTNRKLDSNKAENEELKYEIERIMNENNNLREERDNLSSNVDNLQGMVDEKNRNIDG